MPTLSSYFGPIFDRLESQPLQRCSFLSPSPETCSPSEELPASVSSLESKAMEMAGRIIKIKEEHREKAKLALRLQQVKQEQMVLAVASAALEQLKRSEELMELKQRQEFMTMMDQETKETLDRQETVQEWRHRMQALNLPQRKAERQRLHEAELEKRRQAEGQDRWRSLNTIQEEILRLNQLLEPSTSSFSFTDDTKRGHQLCSQVSEVVRKIRTGEFPSAAGVATAERALNGMRVLIRPIQEEAAAARAQEEAKREQEAQMKAAQLAEDEIMTICDRLSRLRINSLADATQSVWQTSRPVRCSTSRR